MLNFGYEDLADIYEYGSPSRHGKHRQRLINKAKARRRFKRVERLSKYQIKLVILKEF